MNQKIFLLFLQWKLPYTKHQPALKKNQLWECSWKIEREKLTFASTEFEVQHYKAEIEDIPGRQEQEEVEVDPKKKEEKLCQAFTDVLSFENEFCILDEGNEDIHPLARWYGIREFVVIVPIEQTLNESQIRILLSSIHICAADSNTEIPVFVQVLKKRQNVFLGVCESQSTRLSFDIVHLRNVPQTCRYLTDIMSMFHAKVGLQYRKPVQIGARYTFQLNKFYGKSCYKPNKSSVFTADEEEEDDSDDETFRKRTLPFGTSLDPVKEIQLNCMWQNAAGNIVMDNSTYTDFDPIKAESWTIRAKFETNPICYASECLADYIYQCESRIAIIEYYPHLVIDVGNEAKVLDKIADSRIPSILPAYSAHNPTHAEEPEPRKLDGPIPEITIVLMLYYLFPDAQPELRNNYAIPTTEPVSLIFF